MAEIHDHAGTSIAPTSSPHPVPSGEALAALNGYMDAWNRRDIEGMDAAFHFPHVRIASGGIIHLESAASRLPDFFEKFVAATGWHYSLWDYRRAVQSTNDKVHFAVQFSRYRADGSVIGAYPSMWIVREDRRPVGRAGALELRAVGTGRARPLSWNIT